MSLLHHRIALVGAGIAVAAITVLTTTTTAAATPATTDRVQAAGGWLATQFVDASHRPAPDGNHFDQRFGKKYFPLYGQNADVIFGLSAAKTGRHKINVAFHYLAHHLHGYADLSGAGGFGPADGAIGKVALAAIVIGRNPRDVTGHNLIAKLHHDECPSGSTKCTPGEAANPFSSIGESFVILAEQRAGASRASAAAISYFLSLQCANGGFTDGTKACGSGRADLDSTSYAIMALTALGAHPGRLHDAVAWLRSKQRSKGYWVSQHVPNTDSTGLAAAALRGAGAHIRDARSWLRSQQIKAGAPGAGAFRYAGDFQPTKSATSPSVLATAQALTGLADHGSLATLTAAKATRGTAMYAPVIKAPRRVQAGSDVTVKVIGFAAGEQVSCELDADRAGVGFGTLANAAGVVTARVHLGHLFVGTHRIKCDGASTNLHATRLITVVASS